jgi:hypothetical protein
MNSSQNNIYPKPCTYGCNTQIYWNTSVNEYWEVFTKKKHICPNRVYNNKPTTNTITTSAATTTNMPNYYNRFTKQPKPKMPNSFELLTGPIDAVQKKYEVLSDIVSEYNGKVHGSQRDRDPKTGLLDLLVYYEVPEGQRDEVKNKFESVIKNEVKIYQR